MRAASGRVRSPVLLGMCVHVVVIAVTTGAVRGGGPALLPIAVSLVPVCVVATAAFIPGAPFLADI